MADLQQLVKEAARCVETDQLARAEEIYRQLLVHAPGNADILRALGMVARKQDRVDEAVALGQESVEKAPANALNHFELGATYIKVVREDLALPHFLKAYELQPDFQQACVNVGAILEHQERFSEALAWSQRAVEMNPRCAIARYNLGNIFRELGDTDRALEAFEQAIAINPDSAKSHWNAAFCHLSRGQFQQGWEKYEWRERAGEVMIDRYTQPRWDGSSLRGKTILVHAEQGIGDEILFASCLPDLIEQAEKVLVVCDPRLQAIYRRSFPRAEVRGWQRRKDWMACPWDLHYDYQIPAGSVPKYLRSTSASFPQRKQFLVPDAARVAQWQARYQKLGPGLKVGISWQAGGQPTERRKRTIPLDQWMGIHNMPGVQLINLQYGERDVDLIDARNRLGLVIHDWSDCDPLVDMDGFAAKVAALDLVISVGNATVHMAGAIGTPAWALIPQIPSWRWMSNSDLSNWYTSVRLFRQQQRGQWGPVFEKIIRMLGERMGNHEMAGTPRRRTGIGFDVQGNAMILGQPGPSVTPPQAVAPSVTLPSVTLPPVAAVAVTPPLAVPAIGKQGSFMRTDGITASFDRGVAALNAGDLKTAEMLLQEILDHTPRHHGALHAFGVMARLTGRPELAMRSLQRALAVDAADAKLHLHLGDTYKDLKQYKESISAYLRALEIHPNYPDALHNMGNVLRKWGKPAEAIRCFQQAIQLQPRFAGAYNSLGISHLEAKRYEDAVTTLRQAVELDPNAYGAYNNLGRALQATGMHQEAIRCFNRTLELAPACLEALYNLGQSLLAISQLDAARRAFQQVLEFAPNHGGALAALQDIAMLPAAAVQQMPVAGPHFVNQRRVTNGFSAGQETI